MAQKPKLHTLHGKHVADVDKLAELFFNLTGRQPTAKELEAARKRLAAKPGPK